jgi:hypothetical protein
LDKPLQISAFLYPISGITIRNRTKRVSFYACNVIQTWLIFSSRQFKEIKEFKEFKENEAAETSAQPEHVIPTEGRNLPANRTSLTCLPPAFRI